MACAAPPRRPGRARALAPAHRARLRRRRGAPSALASVGLVRAQRRRAALARPCRPTTNRVADHARPPAQPLVLLWRRCWPRALPGCVRRRRARPGGAAAEPARAHVGDAQPPAARDDGTASRLQRLGDDVADGHGRRRQLFDAAAARPERNPPLRGINASHALAASRVLARFAAVIPLEDLGGAGARLLQQKVGWRGAANERQLRGRRRQRRRRRGGGRRRLAPRRGSAQACTRCASSTASTLACTSRRGASCARGGGDRARSAPAAAIGHRVRELGCVR